MKKNIIALLKKEIEWCQENPSLNRGRDWEAGFMKGLEQAIAIVRKVKTVKDK